MARVNRRLLPIKAHFFFFMAAMGPILPQLSVYGKELGISPVVMGSVTGILPIAFLIAKPLFGILVDVYSDYRKIIFIALLMATTLSYSLLYFVPARFITTHQIRNFTCPLVNSCNTTDFIEEAECKESKEVICNFQCDNDRQAQSNHTFYAIIHPELSEYLNNSKEFTLCNRTECVMPSESCDLLCSENIDANTGCLYKSVTFWSFIVLMSLGTIGFNVANSISDAICCDIVGEDFDYGKQRVWGTLGFGITALISGCAVHFWFGTSISYTPAFIVMIIASLFDLCACFKLELPLMPGPGNIFKNLRILLRDRYIVVFIIFAVLAGVVDSFIVYFLFWYLEDLAIKTEMGNIKLLEGLVVAAETLGAEVLFFYASGKILERFGHAFSFSMCFIFYGLRFGLISIIPSPWWILPIEFLLQGPTYALTYSTIVVYANDISPPGMSATMQGIAAGMDDGFGYAIGSILGGYLYNYVGGRESLQIFSLSSIVCGIVHLLLHKTYLRAKKEEQKYTSPEEAIRVAEDEIK